MLNCQARIQTNKPRPGATAPASRFPAKKKSAALIASKEDEVEFGFRKGIPILQGIEFPAGWRDEFSLLHLLYRIHQFAIDNATLRC